MKGGMLVSTEKVIKYSRQREAIVKFLEGRKDHPTAEYIYKNIREEYPNISLGTVYRNLALLVELGKVAKISCDDGNDHFDPNVMPHYHFICRDCNSVSDVDMDSIDFINTLAEKNFKGRIDGHSTFFYGVCEECLKKANWQLTINKQYVILK